MDREATTPPPRVVITGMGAVSAVGTGCEALWQAVEQGRDGLRPIDRFDTSAFGSRLGGMWPGWSDRRQAVPDAERDLASVADDFPLMQMLVIAANEAFSQARFDPRSVRSGRAAIVFGTCFGQGFNRFAEVADTFGAQFGLTGPRITISTACSSSTNAVGLARDLLEQGRADVVIAVGGDVLLREVYAGFCSLGVVSPEKCAPFSTPYGITLAEGAGVVVVESVEQALSRGATPLVDVLGYGLSADAFHETTPDPTGKGIFRAIRGALVDAGVAGAEVDYVNAHATGTESNDRTEWQAIRDALGKDVPVSATKSVIGHAQGAAGILELITVVMAMQRNVVPPTLRFQGPRPGCPTDPIADEGPRSLHVQNAVNVSAAFGGANAVVVVGRDSSVTRKKQASTRVVIGGMGLVGPRGVGLPSMSVETPIVGDVPPIPLETIVPSADPRRLDPSSRYFTAAAALALRDANIVLRGEERERAGVFMAATRMPAESSARCSESIDRYGVGAASASAFARMSVNSPAGTCAKMLGLKGPSTTLTIGRGSGLFAIASSAQWLATRTDAELLVAGSVDERPRAVRKNRAQDASDTEGAACVVLQKVTEPTPGVHVEILGWGLAAAGDVATACRQACQGEEMPSLVFTESPFESVVLDGVRATGVVDVVDVSQFWGNAEATRSTVAFCMAFDGIRGDRFESALVVAPGMSACVAILLKKTKDIRV